MPKKRRKRGRPRTGRDPMIGVRLPASMIKKIGKIADEKVGKHLPVNVTGAIAAISMDMGFHWQMSKSFAILGRALGGLAHVGEEIRRPIARGISNLIRDNLLYMPEK